MSFVQRISRVKSFVVSLLAVAALVYLDLRYSPDWLLPAVVLVIIVTGLALRALAPIARKRGWGNEYRLTRKQNRPRFEDESRRAAP